MENLEGKSAKAAQVGRGSSQSVTPFTFKMPISKDDLEPIPLHIVKSSIWYEGCKPPKEEEEDNAGEEPKPEYFLKFSPNSEKNRSVARHKAVSLRYFNSHGSLDCIAFPNVAKEDIRVEVHEQQITLFALARDEPHYAQEFGEIMEPSRIYTFNTEAHGVYAIVVGYRKDQLQLFRGMTMRITEQPNLKNIRRRKMILGGDDATVDKDP